MRVQQSSPIVVNVYRTEKMRIFYKIINNFIKNSHFFGEKI